MSRRLRWVVLAAVGVLAACSTSTPGSPTPSASPTPTPSATTVQVPGIGELPRADASVLTASSRSDALVQVSTGTVPALLLAGPAGGLWWLTNLPTDETVVLSAGEWQAGATTALVVARSSEQTGWATLDLLTGSLTWQNKKFDPDLTISPTHQLGVRSAVGEAGYTVIDQLTQQRTDVSWGGGRRCGDPAWLDASTITATCSLTRTSTGDWSDVASAADAPTRVVMTAMTGALVSETPLTAGDPWQEGSAVLIDDGLVFTGWPVPTAAQAVSAAHAEQTCPSQVYLRLEGGTTMPFASAQVARITLLGGSGHIVYLWTGSGCGGSPQPSRLSALNVRSGTSHDVLSVANEFAGRNVDVLAGS